MCMCVDVIGTTQKFKNINQNKNAIKFIYDNILIH